MAASERGDHRPLLDEVAQRIADDATVEWAARLAEHPDAESRLEKLRLLERLAGAFRGAAARLAALPEPPPAHRRLGPYRLGRELGRGGMGVVYLAERVEGGFEQRLAVKLVKRGMDTDAILRRFLRERQILASLEHPNIARLLDGGASPDGQPYLAMEYVDGRPLTEYCQAGGLGVEERLRLFEDACRAVQHAHGRLVVHRDLKPSNMLVTADGRLKLLDFGIAKLLAGDADDATTFTQTDTRVLTPAYAAPEQIRGDAVTTATDVYALGVVLYQLLTGRLACGGDATSVGEMARAVCEVEPRPPSTVVTDPRLSRRLRGDLDTVVLKALGKEASRRYASAEALADDVRRHLAGHPVRARRDTVTYVVGKFVRRHKLGVAAAALIAASLVLGLAGTSWQAAIAARERDRVRLEAQRAESVKEFLVALFRASDPAESPGEEVTARELLARGAQRIERELAGHPALQAELSEIVAGISQDLGHFDDARTLAEKSLARAREAYGGEHAQVARAMNTLAWTRYRAGDYEGSETLGRQALALRRRLLEADDPEVAHNLESLAHVLRVRAKYAEAEALFREALAIRLGTVGVEHADTANVLANLADLLHATGRYAAAAQEHRRALAIRRKALGDVHPAVAASLVALGAALLQEGDPAGAEAAQREALDIRRRVFGEEHPLVAESLHHLAVTVQGRGDLQEAETLFRRTLAIETRFKGKDHADVAVLLSNLAHALAQQRRFDEANRLFDDALALHRRVTGADHPLLARAQMRQAAALVDQGRPRDALPLVAAALAIFRARYPAGHPFVAVAIATEARAKAALGQAAAAETLYREALDLHARLRPAPHPDTVEMLVGLGQVLCVQGRPVEADGVLRQAQGQAEQALPPGHPRRADVERARAACLGR